MKNEFVMRVAEMRDAQRKYFKTRDYADLDKSKKLEREVDKMLADFASKQQAML